MSILLGFQAVMSRSSTLLTALSGSGSAASATWTSATGVHDVKVPLEFSEGDITTRAAGGYELTAAVLTKATVEFDYPFDPTDTDYIALETAAIAKTPIALLFTSAAFATTGSRGLGANFVVTKMERDESAADVQKMNFAVKPYSFPQWFIKP